MIDNAFAKAEHVQTATGLPFEEIGCGHVYNAYMSVTCAVSR